MAPTSTSSSTFEGDPSPPLKPAQNAKSFWITFAVGSGAFAAFNGVFAKLTTGTATQTIIESVSHLFGMREGSNFLIAVVVRAFFFGLNLISNAIMWILFTRALTAGNSTTRVSVINTSSNFFVTAILGMIVFAEGLPLGWWAGAALLVAGSVIIGAREDGTTVGNKSDSRAGVEAVAMGTGGSGDRGASVVEQKAFKDESDQESENRRKKDTQRPGTRKKV